MSEQIKDININGNNYEIHLPKSRITDFPTLNNVATSGSYNDLSNKPQINSVDLSGNKTASDLGLATSTHNHVGVYQPAGSYATTSDLAGKANASHTHAQSDITGLETALAGKASASDLTDLALKVGNESSGLVKAVADLQTDVNGVETELSNING